MTDARDATADSRAPIPLLDLQAQYATIEDEVDAAVGEVMRQQRFILGPEVARFEQEIGQRIGAAHAVGLSSGTDALTVALLAAGVGPGDEVVTTDYSFFATAGTIARLGARPVLVDLEQGGFQLDPRATASRVGPATRAIVAVHLFGQCAAVDQIRELTSDAVPVIEDAAQAIDATLHGRRAGTLGAAACFSFFPSKNLGGCGDGGLLTTDDAELAQNARALRVHGQLADQRGRHALLGGNFRLDALQAAVLRVKLRHLDGWTEARRRNAARYRRLLGEAGLVASGAVRLPPAEEPGCRQVYNQFVIRVDGRRRDGLRRALAEVGVGTGVYYPRPLHAQPCLRERFGYPDGEFPNATAAAADNLALPVYPELSAEQIEIVVERIGRALAAS